MASNKIIGRGTPNNQRSIPRPMIFTPTIIEQLTVTLGAGANGFNHLSDRNGVRAVPLWALAFGRRPLRARRLTAARPANSAPRNKVHPREAAVPSPIYDPPPSRPA